MRVSLFCVALIFPVISALAEDQFHLIPDADFNFGAPIVNNSSNYTNQLPYGSIIYDSSTDQFKGLDRNGTWDAMSSPGAAPNISSSGTGQYHVESAQISATGTINSQTGSWLSAASLTSGVFTLTVVSGEFTATPFCTFTPIQGLTPGSIMAEMLNTSSSTSIVVTTGYANATNSSFATSASAFNVICMGAH